MNGHPGHVQEAGDPSKPGQSQGRTVFGVPPASSRNIPWPSALTAIGPLLCLYPVSEPDALSALAIASRLRVSIRIDTHGPCECLNLFDDSWRPCWRMYRLPDSVSCAWDRLVGECVAGNDDEAAEWPWAFAAGIGRRVLNPIWKAQPLTLQASTTESGATRLAATPAALSSHGVIAARRIATMTNAMLSI